MKVALFITCFNDTLFPDTGRAVVSVLERLGHQVEFPEEQTCCGQMHFNTGYADDGLALARRFERVFDPYRRSSRRRRRASGWCATTARPSPIGCSS